MFLPAAGTEQVVQQRLDVFPARGADLPDHAACSAVTAIAPQGLAHRVGYGVDVVGAAQAAGGVAGQVSGGLPGGGQLRDRLVRCWWLMRRTSPAARISSISISSSGSWPLIVVPFAAAAITACAAYARRAIPACPAASTRMAYSSPLSVNSTVRVRGTGCRARRRPARPGRPGCCR